MIQISNDFKIRLSMRYPSLLCVIIMLFFNTSSFASDELHIQQIINFNKDTNISTVKEILGSDDFIFDADNDFVKKECGKLSEMKFSYDNNELNTYTLDVSVLDDYKYINDLHDSILRVMCKKYGNPDKVVSFKRDDCKRKKIKFDKNILIELSEETQKFDKIKRELEFFQYILENDIYYYWTISGEIRSCLSMTEPKSLKFIHAYYE